MHQAVASMERSLWIQLKLIATEEGMPSMSYRRRIGVSDHEEVGIQQVLAGLYVSGIYLVEVSCPDNGLHAFGGHNLWGRQRASCNVWCCRPSITL